MNQAEGFHINPGCILRSKVQPSDEMNLAESSKNREVL